METDGQKLDLSGESRDLSQEQKSSASLPEETLYRRTGCWLKRIGFLKSEFSEARSASSERRGLLDRDGRSACFMVRPGIGHILIDPTTCG